MKMTFLDLFFVSCRTTIPGVVLVETSVAVALVVVIVGWVLLMTMLIVVVTGLEMVVV